MGAALIIALTAVLLAGWRVDERRHFTEVVGQMYSFTLVGALAFSLALRSGAIDLSVWATAALGGAAAVLVARTGAGAGATFAAAGAAGLIVGAIHGLLVARLRLPSLVVTLVTGAIIVWALRWAFDGRQIAAPAESFAAWLARLPTQAPGRAWLPWTGRPPVVLRMLLVAAIYLAVLAGLAVVDLIQAMVMRGRNKHHPRAGLFASLCASGLLAGLAGGVWLAEHGWSPVPTKVIGDLRICAAAILAGAALFAGQARTPLVVLALPATALAATIWRMEVAHLPAGGHYLQVVLLIGMTIVTHLTILELIQTRGRGRAIVPAAAAAALTAGGIIVFAAAGGREMLWSRRLCHLAGLSAWMAGAITLILCRIISRRRNRARQ